MLWVVELVCQCGGKQGHFVWSVKQFFFSFFFSSSLLPPLHILSTVYQCDRCLSSHGHGGSWLGCQVFPPIGAVSIFELAAKSGSSRMSWAPNFHLAMQLLNNINLLCDLSIAQSAFSFAGPLSQLPRFVFFAGTLRTMFVKTNQHQRI